MSIDPPRPLFLAYTGVGDFFFFFPLFFRDMSERSGRETFSCEPFEIRRRPARSIFPSMLHEKRRPSLC